MLVTPSKSTAITANIAFAYVADPARAQRLANLLFSASTGLATVPSTGVAS